MHLRTYVFAHLKTYVLTHTYSRVGVLLLFVVRQPVSTPRPLGYGARGQRPGASGREPAGQGQPVSTPRLLGFCCLLCHCRYTSFQPRGRRIENALRSHDSLYVVPCTLRRYDVLSSRDGLVAQANLTTVADGLLSRIGLFRRQFHTGDWRLWNGNNWTPRLSVGALYWAVTFWHEQRAVAEDVLRMVNDLLWLHYPVYYLGDGTPVEGISYSYMSIEDAVELSEMQRASFGSAPQAISTSLDLLQGALAFHIASMSGDGKMLDFGDSHAIAGFSPRTLELAAMRRIVLDEPRAPLAMTACQARELCSGMYGSYGIYVDPWRVSPTLATLSAELATLATSCAATSPAEPLGGVTEAVFLDGMFASLRVPLMSGGDMGADPPCFSPNDGGPEPFCIDATMPSLADEIPYSKLGLNGRPSSFIKSEVDFGTLTWSAWGARFISEFGYGTIATSQGGDDTRRMELLDNNPAGHNTVIVREAFQSSANGQDETEINFSQFNFVSGRMLVANISRGDGGGGSGDAEAPCVLLDGSAVYGAERPDGWLDVMRRYACPIASVGTHAFLVVDVLRVKEGRVALALDGDGHGGPTYTEGEAHAKLQLDEYFFTVCHPASPTCDELASRQPLTLCVRRPADRRPLYPLPSVPSTLCTLYPLDRRPPQSSPRTPVAAQWQRSCPSTLHRILAPRAAATWTSTPWAILRRLGQCCSAHAAALAKTASPTGWRLSEALLHSRAVVTLSSTASSRRPIAG